MTIIHLYTYTQDKKQHTQELTWKVGVEKHLGFGWVVLLKKAVLLEVGAVKAEWAHLGAVGPALVGALRRGVGCANAALALLLVAWRRNELRHLRAVERNTRGGLRVLHPMLRATVGLLGEHRVGYGPKLDVTTGGLDELGLLHVTGAAHVAAVLVEISSQKFNIWTLEFWWCSSYHFLAPKAGTKSGLPMVTFGGAPPRPAPTPERPPLEGGTVKIIKKYGITARDLDLARRRRTTHGRDQYFCLMQWQCLKYAPDTVEYLALEISSWKFRHCWGTLEMG